MKRMFIVTLSVLCLTIMTAGSTAVADDSEIKQQNELPVAEGTSVEFDRMHDLQATRLKRIRSIRGSILAQRNLVQNLEEAYRQTGDFLYSFHALYYEARIINDRIKLAGEAKLVLAELDELLGRLPVDAVGVFLEQKIEETARQLEGLHGEYHQQDDELSREEAKEAFVEVYSLLAELEDLRDVLEKEGDAGIKQNRAQIRRDETWLEKRLARDRIAAGVIEGRLPVLKTRRDLDIVRQALDDLRGPMKELGTSALQPRSDEVAKKAESALNDANWEAKR